AIADDGLMSSSSGPDNELRSYRGHRYPIEIISHVVWLYFRLHLSLRDVKELPTERGITGTCEAVRAWSARFGPDYTTVRTPHLLHQQTLRSHLQDVRVLESPRARLALDRTQHFARLARVVRAYLQARRQVGLTARDSMGYWPSLRLATYTRDPSGDTAAP